MKAVAAWPTLRKIDVMGRAARTLDSDTSVRLRVLDVGVCGTDAEICRFDCGGTPPPGEDHPMEQFCERAGDGRGIKDVITVGEAK